MKQLLPLYLVIIFGYFGFSMMVPIFSAILIEQTYPLFPPGLDIGERTFLLGLLLAMYPLGQFFGSPIVGSLSDKYGRKPLLLWTLSAVALMLLAVSFCIHMRMPHLLYLIVFITGFFESNISIAQSAIADISTPEEKSHRLGFTLAFASIGFTLGPPFGGFLAQRFSYATPFWIIPLILLCFILWIAIGFKETHPENNRIHVNFMQAATNLHHVITDPKLRPVYALSFTGGLIFFGFLRLFPAYLLNTFHINLSEVSLLIAVTNLPLFITLFLFIKPLVAKFGPKVLGALAFSGLFLCLILFMCMKTLTGVIIATLLCALFLPIGGALYASLISARAGLLQGRALGNNTSVLVGAQVIAILVFNALAGISYLLSYGLIALCALINVVNFLRLKSP